ncbi:MAG: hypothetical protein ACI8ZF_000469 [Candidatus Midichloriaceae bacterium]|jgi:hypothetical protein
MELEIYLRVLAVYHPILSPAETPHKHFKKREKYDKVMQYYYIGICEAINLC